MILQPISLKRRSSRSFSAELDLSSIQSDFETSYFSEALNIFDDRHESDIKSLIEKSDSSCFRAFKVDDGPESNREGCSKVKLEILPASDLILSDTVEFLLELPESYPSTPPIVTCLSRTKDVKNKSEINGCEVNLPLFQSEISWRRSYKLDVAAYALRRIFLRTDLEPWELTCCIYDKDFAYLPDGHCITKGGHFGSLGGRSTMEDAFAIKEGFDVHRLGGIAPPISYYAIFDGHGGNSCSNFAAEKFESSLKTVLTSSDSNCIDWSRSLCLALRDIDRAYIKTHQGRGRTGSTALCVIFNGKDRLFTANLGDSRAVLCRGINAIDLTQDCKASRSDEVARIVANGGFIDNGRVRGQLAVSRSLGDASYKSSSQMLVSRDAEFTEVKLTEQDSFFIIACDGLWDVMTSQEAVDFVRRLLIKCPEAPLDEISRRLVLHAVNELSASDNVSAIVVKIESSNSYLVTPRNEVLLTEVPENLAITPPIYTSKQTAGQSFDGKAVPVPHHCDSIEAFPLGNQTT